MRKAKAYPILAILVVAAVAAATIAVIHARGTAVGKSASTAYAASGKPVAQSKPTTAKESAAEKAIRSAAGRQRYVVVTFYKKGDAAGSKMLAAVKSMQSKLSNRADFVTVDSGNPANQALVTRYGVDRAPSPLTLALAPNGAVTAGFPNEIKTTDFSNVFVSGGEAAVLKTLQSGKLALVCLQNGKTKYNKASVTAAEGLKADKTLPGSVGIVKIDPSDRRESEFLQKCRVNAGLANSQVMMIIPPGRILGTFDGNTTKDKLMASLQSALKSCGSGCGPSGCGP